MTTFLWNTTQAKDVAKIPLVTQSAENLANCLNSLLKAAADIASKDDTQKKVNIIIIIIIIIIMIKEGSAINLLHFSNLRPSPNWN